MAGTKVLANNWRLSVVRLRLASYSLIISKLLWNCCNFYNVPGLLYYILTARTVWRADVEQKAFMWNRAHNKHVLLHRRAIYKYFRSRNTCIWLSSKQENGNQNVGHPICYFINVTQFIRMFTSTTNHKIKINIEGRNKLDIFLIHLWFT